MYDDIKERSGSSKNESIPDKVSDSILSTDDGDLF